MSGISVARNIILQKQTRTNIVSPDEFRGNLVKEVFPYLFVNTPRRAGSFNSPPSVLVSNSLDVLTDRSLGGSPEYNDHEVGNVSYNAALIITPMLYEKYADRLNTLFGAEQSQTSLKQRIETNNRARHYVDTISFKMLADHEIEEIISHLVVFSGDSKSEEPLQPLFIGADAARELLVMLVEGNRQDELSAVARYMKENGLWQDKEMSTVASRK